jgi:hypothetical protein
MGVQINFNYANWAALYPEFAYLNAVQANNFFTLATMMQRNDGCGPINDPTMQTMTLYLMTAHVAKLFAPTSTGQNAPDTVGRVANASEGSVSVQLDNQYPPGSAQWFQQTKYGSMWWQATAWTRTMRWIRGPRRSTEPVFAGNFNQFPWGFGTSWGTLG